MNSPEGPEVTGESLSKSDGVVDYTGAGTGVLGLKSPTQEPGEPDISNPTGDRPTQPVDPNDPGLTFRYDPTLPSPSEPANKINAAELETGDLTGTSAPPAVSPDEILSSDRIANEEFRNVTQLLRDASRELQQLTNKEDVQAIQKLIQSVEEKTGALIKKGSNASASQVLVVVLAWSGAGDELASRAQSSGADEEVFHAIQGKFDKARLPLWSALASLGKVKEWSATLEIGVDFFAIKGTGGISVTFGK